MPSARGLGLRELLRPLTKDRFFRDHWEKRPLRLSGDARRFESLLRLRDVDSLACFGVLSSSESDVRLAKTEGGKFASRPVRTSASGIPDPYGLYRAHHEGQTLIVNRVDARWRPIAALCRALEWELHHRVNANLYFTPPRAQGFAPHFDTHDVFILQLEGEKDWRFFGSVPLPLEEDNELRGPEASAPGRASRTLTLRPGDLLYVPRGVVHDAVSRDSSSLHLTVGVHVTRWLDLARQALEREARADDRLREALPPGFLDPGRRPALRARLGELLAAAAKGRAADLAVDGISERRLQSGSPLPDGHFSALERATKLSDDTFVARRGAMPCAAFREGRRAGIRFPGNTVTGPEEIASALRYVAANRRFKVSDLPGPISAGSKRTLVRKLIREGLLTFAGQSGRNS
ncbi:MAG: cupin domain-containing protein [Elusimicrobiota bacterium]|nr:MAG: cupin domain-containing protein [Elusimicrobiota bacterium]